MRKILLFSATVFAFYLGGCKTGDDPKTVLMNLMNAMERKDINTAQQYVTKQSEIILRFMQMEIKRAPQSMLDTKFNYENLDYGAVKIEGDSATIAVSNKKTGDVGHYSLKKENGEWKVSFDRIH